jgi:hypothetical protein
MARQFVSAAGAHYPATLADYKRAKAGELDKVKWAEALPGKPLEAPYQEIVASWLANGFEEVSAGGLR